MIQVQHHHKQSLSTQQKPQLYYLRKQYILVPVNELQNTMKSDSWSTNTKNKKQPSCDLNYHIDSSYFLTALTGLYSFSQIFQQQLIQSMPFQHRTLNRFPQLPSPLEHVKKEENSLPIQESSILSSENNLGENREPNEGRWNQEENFRFVLFVHYYQDIFASQHKRKACKIFRTFSEYLTERTAAQCRSHYQKMIIKHKTIAKLKKHYKALYGDRAYNQEFQSFKAEWETTHPPAPKVSTQIREFREIAIQTDQPVAQRPCENCLGVRSESELMASNTSAFKPCIYWDSNPFQSSEMMYFFYWVPQTQFSQ